MTVDAGKALHAELLDIIGNAITNHPRSLQVRIGPSELGTPCARKLGHKLAHTPPARVQPPGWRPTIGVGTHNWLASTFENDNTRWPADHQRWLVETSVWVGDVDGEMVTGSADLFDLETNTVIDWKVVGPKAIKDYRSAVNAGRVPSDQYRTQLHLYGRGFTQLGQGLPVDRVAIVFLPSAGELVDSVVWSEPYDEQVALDALARADGLAAALRILGPDAVLPQLDAVEDHCGHCPWFIPGATDLTRQCGGAAALYAAPMEMPDLIQASSTAPTKETAA